MTGATLTFKSSVHFQRKRFGRKQMTLGEVPTPTPVPLGRVPRISRLMALAIGFERMLERGEVKDQAELARLGHVSRARLSQIMNLLMLAPDIQEEILFLPSVEVGRDPVKEAQLRPIASLSIWASQRRLWRSVLESSAINKGL